MVGGFLEILIRYLYGGIDIAMRSARTHGGAMSFRCLSWLDSRSSSPGSSRGQSHCVLFRVGQGTLLSHYLLSTCKLQGNQGLQAMPLHPGRLAILAIRKTGVNCQQFCVTMIAQTYLFFLILILRVEKKKENNC